MPVKSRKPVSAGLFVLAFTLVCALLPAVPVTATADPAGEAEMISPNDPRLTFEGHWAHGDDRAITVNSGSSLRFRFTGDRLAARFDTASITSPSQLYVTIDGGDPTLVEVGRPKIVLAESLDANVVHTAELKVKDVDEYANRWIRPLQSGIVLRGLELSPQQRVLPVRRSQRHRLEFYGDSITQGVMALCSELGSDCADGTKTYAHLVGTAFDANTNQVGFGKQGIIQPGHGNVGTASESFGWNLAGYPAEPFRPDAVVINFGTNDAPWSSAEFTPRYLDYLRQVRAANPHTEILALRPFTGTHGKDIASAVAEMDDPGTHYVDTTGWLTAEDYHGGAHPSVAGHEKAATRLVEVLEDRLGWTAGKRGAAAGADSGDERGDVAVQPRGMARPACSDTPLRMTFDEPVRLGDEGRLVVHEADGTPADVIDLADPATYQRTIGGARTDFGELHRWNYDPVVVDGNTMTVHPHSRLAPGKSYYVTVEAGFVEGQDGITGRTEWRFRTRQDPAPGTTRLSVQASGRGDFCTVRGAIDFVPEGNTRSVRIDVGPGIYSEIVYVPPTKPHLTIRGAGRERTVIRYRNNDVRNGDRAMADVPPEQSYCPRRVLPEPDRFNCWRAVLGVDADDVRLSDVTVHNTTPYGGSQAEAVRGNGDRIVLERVNLLSFQDTLRLQGRAFVTDSYIEGDVDFVWGTGGVFMQDSELKALHAGYYTQIRNTDDGPGNVFVNTRLTRAPGVPDDSVYLSRIELNRFPTSQVVFLDSAMGGHVKPVGWQITDPNDCAAADRLRFAEYGSTDLAGRPLDTGDRLPCSDQLSESEAKKLRDPGHVLGWSPRETEPPTTGRK